MKHLIVSLTIGACLLLPSAGVVFATDPHIPPLTTSKTPGRPGSGGVGIQCTAGTGINVTSTLPPGQGQIGATNSSPFLNSSKEYAGAGAGKSGAAGGAPAAQYDVACFQVH
jgi:hypothetical protein